jgi:hypothetical protein
MPSALFKTRPLLTTQHTNEEYLDYMESIQETEVSMVVTKETGYH